MAQACRSGFAVITSVLALELTYLIPWRQRTAGTGLQTRPKARVVEANHHSNRVIGVEAWTNLVSVSYRLPALDSSL